MTRRNRRGDFNLFLPLTRGISAKKLTRTESGRLKKICSIQRSASGWTPAGGVLQYSKPCLLPRGFPVAPGDPSDGVPRRIQSGMIGRERKSGRSPTRPFRSVKPRPLKLFNIGEPRQRSCGPGPCPAALAAVLRHRAPPGRPAGFHSMLSFKVFAVPFKNLRHFRFLFLKPS